MRFLCSGPVDLAQMCMDQMPVHTAGQCLLEQAAQTSQVRVNLQQLPPGLLIFPAFDLHRQTHAPGERRK